MADIDRFPVVHRLRADVSSHIQHFKKGKLVNAGRGLSFWFLPSGASITETPMDDRELPFLVKAQSADFQDLTSQGTILWRVSDPEKLADRIDFTIDLKSGHYVAGPVQQIGNVLVGLVQQFTAQFLRTQDVRSLLQGGPVPLQAQVIQDLEVGQKLAGMGLELIDLTFSSLRPSAELERALQTPTFEALQQKADEATFERRAMAVEKERAIAENTMQNEIEMAAQKRSLIEKEDENARLRAIAAAETSRITAESRAQNTKLLEDAKVSSEKDRMDVFANLDPSIIMALAAREFAAKLNKIDTLNVTPDMLSNLMEQIKPALQAPTPPPQPATQQPTTPRRATRKK